jgi:hypothetical protein
MRLPEVNKKFWVSLGTLLLVGVLLAYYLLVYVKHREEEILAKNYRSLQRIGNNIREVKQVYDKNISQVTIEIADLANDSVYIWYPGLTNLNIKILKSGDKFFCTAQYIEGVSEGAHAVKFRVEASELIRRSLVKHRFDDFFLVRLSRKGTKDICSFSDIAYQTFANRIELQDLNKLFVDSSGIRTIPLKEIKLSGVDYKLLSHRITFRENEDWILCGVLKTSNFEQEARGVDTWTLAFSILIVLVLALAMPLLKLNVMNEIERLRIINVWFTGFSIVIGTAVILLILLCGNQYIGFKYTVDKNLEELSEDIKSRFTAELNAIYTQLDSCRNIIRPPGGDSIYDNIYQVNPVEQENSSQANALKIAARFKEHRFFNETMWLDNKGDLKMIVATHLIHRQQRLLNLQDRKYFSNVLSGNLWTLPDSTDAGKRSPKEFSFQSIRSWSTGSPEAGIGIALEGNASGAVVLAMATRLHSVMNPLLPPGYTFSIIDDAGEVWFHSDTERNTQENFLSEVDYNAKVQAAITGRSAECIESLYNNSRHRLYIQPIDNLPLYLVTTLDLEYYTAPMIVVMTFAVGLLFFYFILHGILLLIHLACVYQPSKLKTIRFFLNWLRPRKNEVQPEFMGPWPLIMPLEKYIRSIVVLAFLILIMIGSLFVKSLTVIAFCFMVVPLYVLVFQYILFERETIFKYQSHWRTRGVLLHPFVWVSFIFIALINWSLCRVIDQFYIAIIIQAVLISLLAVGYQAKFINELNANVFVIRNYHNLYYCMVFLWLILASVLPVISFYNIALREESTLWQRYIQWEAAQNELHREKALERLGVFPEDIDMLAIRGNYLASTGEVERDHKIGAGQIIKDSTELSDLEFIAWPPLEGLIKKSRAIVSESSHDNQWSWRSHPYSSDVHLAFKTSGGEERNYISKAAAYSSVHSEYFILFVIVLLIAAFLVAQVSFFAIRTIFGLGIVLDNNLIYQAQRQISKDDLIHKTIRENTQRIFLVGLPYSGKNDILQSFKDAVSVTNRDSFKEINFRNSISLPERRSFNVILIKHFEHGINQPGINDEKLKLLSSIIDCPIQIIISSAVSPAAIIDFYEDAIKRLVTKDSEDAKKQCSEHRYALRKWKNVLSGFVVLYQPLAKTQGVDHANPIVQSELQYGRYLPGLAPLFRHDSPDTYEKEENFVLQVEEVSTAYYHSLWNSFSNPEKFLLFDLAKDRFVNLRNAKVIRMLLQKGVIIAEDSLQIMNRSFNSFILSTVNEAEELRMERELNNKGSWSIMHTVLMILLFGLITFIVLAQQHLLDNINVLLAVLGSVIGLLTKFGGLFGSSKPKE